MRVHATRPAGVPPAGARVRQERRLRAAAASQPPSDARVRSRLRAAASLQPPELGAEVEEVAVALGGGRKLRLLRPTAAAEATRAAAAAAAAAPSASPLYGAGDVVWPSSLALARLLLFCPSFVAARDVVDLGCGLGLAASAAAASGARSVTLADADGRVLTLALASARLNAGGGAGADGATPSALPPPRLSALLLDWSSPQLWPAGCADTVVASDVLYNSVCASALPPLLARLLRKPLPPGAQQQPRALLADPPQRGFRAAFAAACAAVGLDAQEGPLPGPEGAILLNVVWRGGG